jgi:LmbE family N-acetylglucosaminyl deacetylase
MKWIYLSPHLDDAALSCGGLIWAQTQRGDHVEIWTICAGDPPTGKLSPFAEELHQRWQSGIEAAARRREEDLISCQAISATPRHFPLPDCIYRRAGEDYWQAGESRQQNAASPGAFLYPDYQAIFGALHPLESDLVQQLARRLDESLPLEAVVVCPLTVGGHVDHRLTRLAAEQVRRDLWYYADYPYADDLVQRPEQLERLAPANAIRRTFRLNREALQAWGKAVAAHRSQLSTFWPDLKAMQAALQGYYTRMGGAVLWSPPVNSGDKLA